MTDAPSARTTIAETLKLRLPEDTYRIIAAATIPDNVTRPTVLVWQENVRRHDQIGHDRVLVDVAVMLMVGNEDLEKAEAALEDGLSDLIEAMRPIDWAHWTDAERLTYGPPGGPTFHAYRVTLSSLAKIGS